MIVFKEIKSDIINRSYIEENSEIKGIIELSIEDNYIDIKYIKIYEEYRRTGAATRVINYLLTTTKYIIGDALPEALDFWKSLDIEFYKETENNLIPFCIKNKN